MKILVWDPISEIAINELKKMGHELFLAEKIEVTDDLISNCEIFIVRSKTKVRKDLLDKATNLKLIVRAGVGLDNIDLNEAKKRGVQVKNTPEAPSVAVAELTIGLILSVTRKISYLDSRIKEGVWAKKEGKGMELFGKTLGVIGTGRIGQEVIKRAIAFGMNVLGYDIIKYAELERLENFKYVSLDYLLKNSDIITLHVPLLDATRHMINKDAIEKMKDGVIIVNASRGGLIDEKALLEALKSRKVSGAALDVFETEPNPDPELVKLPNVVATPHVGSQTRETQDKIALEIVKIIKDF